MIVFVGDHVILFGLKRGKGVGDGGTLFGVFPFCSS